MNKRLSWVTSFGTAAFLTFSAGAALAQSSTAASSINITCKTDTTTPKVIATLSQEGSTKNTTILSFLPEYFSPQDAVQSCQNTAKTLQGLYQTNQGKYLTNDKLNAKPVICAVERRGVDCSHYSARVLFALKPETEPSLALYNMLGKDFKQSTPPNSRTVSRIYSDIKPIWSRFLRW